MPRARYSRQSGVTLTAAPPQPEQTNRRRARSGERQIVGKPEPIPFERDRSFAAVARADHPDAPSGPAPSCRQSSAAVVAVAIVSGVFVMPSFRRTHPAKPSIAAKAMPAKFRAGLGMGARLLSRQKPQPTLRPPNSERPRGLKFSARQLAPFRIKLINL